MKIFLILSVAFFATSLCRAQLPPPTLLTTISFDQPQSKSTNAPVNYVIKVVMKDTNGATNSLRVTTIDGAFELDTIQKNSVKINGNDIPTTLRLSGTLTAINEHKGVLKFYLGHSVPYVTGSYGSPPAVNSSYSQMQVGLNSSFVVNYGKPLVVQSDDSGEVTVLVTRED